MQEWRDEVFMQSEDYLILPAKHLGLRGLHLFGHAEFGSAYPGLVEHVHPGCIEITAMLRGSQKYTTGRREYSLHGGDVYSTFLDEGHSTGQRPQEVSEIIWFQLDLREEEHFLGLAPPWDERLFAQMRHWNRRIIKMEPEELELLRRAFRGFASAKTEDDPMRCLGQSMLLAFLHGMLAKESALLELTSDIQVVITYIQSHITERLEIENLAEMTGLSPTWFKTKFREETGISPREYINRRKIELAEAWIQEGEASVTKLANGLSFATSSYFSTVFRQFTGMSPREYLQSYRRAGINVEIPYDIATLHKNKDTEL